VRARAPGDPLSPHPIPNAAQLEASSEQTELEQLRAEREQSAATVAAEQRQAIEADRRADAAADRAAGLQVRLDAVETGLAAS